MQEAPVHRRYHHSELTFSLVYAFSEQFVLPLSHDEVVHGKGSVYGRMPGDHWQRLAGCRALYLYQWTHPGKQLLFMGSEYAQGGEWTEQHELDWFTLDDPGHAGVSRCVRDLNRVYQETPALWRRDHAPDGFEWIDSDDSDGNTLAYLRRAPGTPTAVVVVNFSGVPREQYRLALPHGGRWREAINTDSPYYGGSGVGNLGEIQADPIPQYGRPFSASVRIPPLGGVIFVAED
jgi:1,4-alpha-glucan branching enzyme